MLLEIFYYNRDHNKISFLVNSIDNNLFDPEEFPILITLKSEIVLEGGAPKYRRKLFALVDGGSSFCRIRSFMARSAWRYMWVVEGLS